MNQERSGERGDEGIGRRGFVKGGAGLAALAAPALIGMATTAGAQTRDGDTATARDRWRASPAFLGKAAFVTGSANGIGRATALAFAREGANVVMVDLHERGNLETAHMIEQNDGRGIAITGDVSQGDVVRP